MMVVVAAVVARIARTFLAGIENPVMAVWPAQVIFGFYFAVLAVAIQRFLAIRQSRTRSSARKALLLLSVIGLCLDLVLVNVQEAVTRVDASYGIVALWDVATFFIWMRAIDLCSPRSNSLFRRSVLVSVAPLFALGREILFLPYSSAGDVMRAYLDLLFGNLFVCFWLFMPAADSPKHRSTMVFSCVVFIGCCYWLLNSIENIANFAWPPLDPVVYAILRRAHVPVFLLSALYAIFAAIFTFVVWRWDVFHIGSLFGITRLRTAGRFIGTGPVA